MLIRDSLFDHEVVFIIVVTVLDFDLLVIMAVLVLSGKLA